MSGDIFVGAANGARDALDYWTLGATIAGVVILAIYTAATLWQAKLTNAVLAETRRSNEAIQKSNEIAAESNRMQREAIIETTRARVVMTSGPYNAPLTAGESQVVFNIKNMGLGCASNLVIKTGYGIFSAPLKDCSRLKAETIFLSRAKFGSGANAALRCHFEPLTEEDVSDLNARRRWLYALAVLTYEDGTGSERITRVCVCYSPDNTNSPQDQNWELTLFCNDIT